MCWVNELQTLEWNRHGFEQSSVTGWRCDRLTRPLGPTVCSVRLQLNEATTLGTPVAPRTGTRGRDGRRADAPWRQAGLPPLACPRPTLRSGTPAAGCPASAPSWASWWPWLPVAPSPSWATVCTSTGSGVTTPRSSAACGTVSATAAWRGGPTGRGGAVVPRYRGTHGAHAGLGMPPNQHVPRCVCRKKSPAAKGR